MSAKKRMSLLLDGSPRTIAKIAGVFYLVNIATSLIAFSGKGSHSLMIASGIIATAAYVAVTILLYYLFKPVNAGLSLLAAFFSLTGCVVGVLGPFHLVPFHIHSLVFFGFYCLLIGILIFESNFLPKFLGGLMVIAGLGWLTFVSRPFAASLSPYHYVAGGIGEGILTLWLLFMGVDTAHWNEQSNTRSAVAL